MRHDMKSIFFAIVFSILFCFFIFIKRFIMWGIIFANQIYVNV
ncbi:hypothetical protein HMPREF3293_02711 [Christensenella minuta]|uniref:Uncharacterized protein n=1 Tax=Christensenella minuta TaxID=626937 RepID=A0A136Q1R5_9FIRM|nr:hypothetical protein HMPREF3293_02711 [Christensenella minuta]